MIRWLAPFLLFAGPVRADWPEFRGPTGQGISTETNLPIEWGPAKNVAWKTPIPGLGWSSPVIAGGKVYLTTAEPIDKSENADQSLRAICLDAASGKILWNVEVFRQQGATAPRVHAKNSHASPTAILDGQRLFVHFGHQGTAALDLDGKVLWKNVIAYRPVHGNGGSPVLVDDHLIFSCDGANAQFVVALDKASGKVKWQTERKTTSFKKFSFGTPLVIRVNGRKQVVSPGAGLVAAYDPATGKEIWRCRYGDGYSQVPRPVFGQGLVFVCTGYDDPELHVIRPDGQGDVTESHVAWMTVRGVSLTPSPLVIGDEFYMISDLGVACCLDAKTGQPHWQERIGGQQSASPLYAEGRIYFQNEDGLGVVIQASKEFKVLARNALKEKTYASYAVYDGALFIRTENHLYRIQKK